MAYQSGSCESLPDLLAKLRLFAEPVGWVTTAVSQTAWAFKSSQGGDFTLRVSTHPEHANTIEMHGSTGNITGQLNPTAHPGSSALFSDRSVAAGLFRPGSGGPYTRYHFFGTMQYLHVVLEVQSGVFAHMQIGRLSKRGVNYSGGEYLQANYFFYPHSPIIRPTGEGSIGNWRVNGPTNAPWVADADKGSVRLQGFAGYPAAYWSGKAYGIGKGPYSAKHPDIGVSAACRCDFLRKPLIVPNRVLMPERESTSSARIVTLGETPDFGITDVGRNAPEDLLVYGEDRWMVFPAYRRGTEFYNYSVDVGYAYLLRD